MFRAYRRMLTEAIHLLVSVAGPGALVLVVGFTAVLALQDKLAWHADAARALAFVLFVLVWVCFFAVRGDLTRVRRQLRDQARVSTHWEGTSPFQRAYVRFLCRALVVPPPTGEAALVTAEKEETEEGERCVE